VIPDLASGLAHHTPRPELAAACAAFDLHKSGKLEVLAERAAGWVNAAAEVGERRRRAAKLMSQFRADTLRNLAGYVLEKPKGRPKAALAQALAGRFVPTPEMALNALGFEVIAQAGKGAFGSVYKVRRLSHPRKLWAAKVVAGDARTHAQEAANLARLRHPNILRYFSDFPGCVPVIVTEWCGGGTLSRRLGKDEIGKTFTVAHVAKEVCDALAYLHKQCVFHRDLHTGNVLFRKNGELVVADFGLSRRKGARPGIRHYNDWLGDPAKATNGAYDVFMLGQMLVSMRKGRIASWCQSDVPSPRDNHTFWDLVRAALDTDPSERPTAADFVTAIKADFTPEQLLMGKRRLIVAATT
jgi:serine/threonine protein kinase